jgi:TRAP-type C4-dicarboxylate transport system substrate-binding protein
VRTPKDPERVRLFLAFGANAMSMPFGELFTALRQGAIDGQENPLAQIVSARLYEVQKYLSVSRHVYSPGYPVMARAFFESLPADVQQVVREAAEATGAYQRELGEREDEELLALCARHLEVTEIDRAAFEAAARPIYEEFARRVGADVIDELRGGDSNAAGSGTVDTIAARHDR